MLGAVRLFVPVLLSAVIGALLGTVPALSKEFTFSEKANQEMARKLGIPVYFALPASARATLPKSINTSDRLIDFKHPDAKGSDIGLRLVVTERDGMARRLGRSGLIQTGDLLLSFRPEWGGAGAYPNIQMGISHTGMAYVKDGTLHNLDNPMDEEYLGAGMRTDLTSKHYSSLNMIHVIRPRNLTDEQRARLLTWATRLVSSARRVYPDQINFNQNYNAPKYSPGKPVTFVQKFGQIGLGQNPPGTLGMYCSEFAWSLLSLRDCDPAKTDDAFKGSSVPACVKSPMDPMPATGDYFSSRSRTSYAGLVDGPLMVVDAMKLPAAERDKLLQSIFVTNPSGLDKLSAGHKALAVQMQPKFAQLQKYYLGAAAGGWRGLMARPIRSAFNKAIPDNYSPTSFLINTLLPPNNAHRTMDYVATIVIE